MKNGMGIPARRKGYSVLRNVLLTALILAAATLICLLLRQMDEGDIYVSMTFLLAVAVVARITDGFVYGIAASVIGVLGVNFAFTKPYFEFCLSLSGYPLAFLSMLAVSVTTSAMTTQIKWQEEQHYRAELEEMRANLLRAVSHDLRTPLTAISGRIKARRRQKNLYCFFKCPQCGTVLRVPKGKGHIRITCKCCGHVFERNS